MYIEILKDKEGFISISPNDKEKIRKIQNYLNNKIPPSYETYLKEIGHGGIAQFDIIGTGARPEEASLIAKNEKYHKDANLPQNYILIMNIGDDVKWYLDLNSRRADGECKVIGLIEGLTIEQQPQWVKDQETYETFYDFFKAKVIKRVY